MATDSAPPQSKSFFRRFLDGLWRLIRFLIVLITLIGLGVLIFYGGKLGYESILLPLNQTITRVEVLEEAMQEERDGMTAQLTLRDERITELESQLTKQKGQLTTQNSTLDAQQVELETLTTLTSELDALQKSLNATNSDLKTMTSELADLQAQATAQEEATASLSDQSESFTTDLESENKRIDTLQDALADTATMLDRVEQERLLLHAQANILNAQRSLSRRDIGLANEYLQRAEVSLKAVSNAVQEDEQAPIALVLTRLNQALDRLQSDPFSASTDLQGIWRALDSVILGDLSIDLPLPADLSDVTPEEEAATEENPPSEEEDAATQENPAPDEEDAATEESPPSSEDQTNEQNQDNQESTP